MSTAASAVFDRALYEQLAPSLDARTRMILERRRADEFVRRGWLMRRMLLGADLSGLALAFLVAELFTGLRVIGSDPLSMRLEYVLFLLTLPVWAVAAKIYGLYDRDVERNDHSTADDFVRVFHLVTVGAWGLLLGAHVSMLAAPQLPKVALFWALAIALISTGRAIARACCRRSVAYLQNTIIIGAGDVGQLVARKFLQHPEYGINLVGFVDSAPKDLRTDLGHVAMLGGPEKLRPLVRTFDIERVVVAFANESHADLLEVIRTLRGLDVQIDIVPRLFEAVGPKFDIHNVEGLPLVGLPPTRISRSSLFLKRMIDVVVAAAALIVLSPVFALIAWFIARDSEGPIFFRQTRLGMDQRAFTTLKFRTMKVGTSDAAHREYVKQTMDCSALPNENGIFKLDRSDAVTRVGLWLRKTSLDELPQLINVLRGDMSLVGPRPCIPYETANFADYHFERFHVPAGVTGLWQVTARAHATFGEALDMDVAYARSWSLGLDLWLLFRTPFKLVTPKGTR
ncbi:MAG: hypothetical protein QOE36_1126 [Gaiellaceae bacterium]|jgi:exopolysaccharide biosynthesis polyprenyl glycosylphosphotransferase|nr:hypothetical protein [Gaiellaceae bacterium]